MSDPDGDLLEYVKGFVHDKNGHCLKSEIIQSIVCSWIGTGELNKMREMKEKLYKKLNEFEKNKKYEGTGVSTERSKLTGRILYKYVEVIDLMDLINLID